MLSYIDLIYLFLTFSLVSYFNCVMLTPRTKHIRIIYILIPLSIVTFWLFILRMPITGFISISINLACMLSCILLFKERFLLKLCTFFIDYIVLTLGEVFSGSLYLLITLIFPKVGPQLNDLRTSGRFDLIIPMNICALFFMLFAFYNLQKLLKNYYSLLKPTLLLRLGIPLFLSLFLQAPLHVLNSAGGFLYYSIFYWFTVVLFVFMLNSALKDLGAQKALNVQMKTQEELLSKRLEDFRRTEQQYQSIRKWNHDISNHLLALSYLIDQGKTAEAEIYIESIFKYTRLEQENNDKI